jgi:hypothetical protein
MPALRPSMAQAIGIVTFALLALFPRHVQANSIIDLTAAGASPATNQGAIFSQTSLQPTGTGVFDPFVRIQQNGTEAGYNTDARPVEFQTKDQNQWTHSLTLNSLSTVSMNGTQYYQFTLDINEQGNKSGALISMDDFRVYLGNSGSLTGFNDGFGSNSVKVYDMDAVNDTTVDLNAKLNPPGSGVADLNVYIPVSAFAGFGSQFQYVYLYSSFGNPHASDAGFEEWASLNGKNGSSPPPPSGVPAPPGLLLGLLGIGAGLVGYARRKASASV